MALALAALNTTLRRGAARFPSARATARALRRVGKSLSTPVQRALCRLWLDRNMSNPPSGPVARPVFVLFTPRSGSQLLQEHLNSVPSVALRGELLHHVALRSGRCSWVGRWLPERTLCFGRRDDYRRYLTGRLAAQDAGVSGCALSMFQLEGTGLRVDDLVGWFPDARFIVLYRRSLTEQYLSWELSLRTRQWRWNAADQGYRPFGGRIRLEREAVLAHFELVRRFYGTLIGHPEVARRSRVLSYEELRDAPQRAFDEILLPWLELPRAVVSNERLRKQGTRLPSDVIENYAELEDVLTGPIAQQRYSLPLQPQKGSGA